MNVPKPTESELEILQILWQKKEATVKEVNEEVSKTKETGYTTTLKLMQIMHEKELVSRNSELRQHLYKAIVAQKDIQKDLLNRFIGSAFQGQAMSLVMQTLGNHSASKEEINQLKELVKTMEENTK